MKRLDLKNKKFGKLTVIENVGKNKNGISEWLCLCECGKTTKTITYMLTSGRKKSCGCLRHNSPSNKIENRELAIQRQLYNSTIIKRSNKNQYKTDIDFETFIKISKSKCFYCGEEPFSVINDRRGWKNIGNVSDVSLVYNGIDRIDSKIGYFKSNVVPCCKHCNTAKNTLTNNEFRKLIINIYNNFIKNDE